MISIFGNTVEEPVVKKIVKKFDGPGRGRKHCPSCDSYIGVRTKVCSCGHKFVRTNKLKLKAEVRKGAKPSEGKEVGSPEKKEVSGSPIPKGYSSRLVIPAGRPSAPLRGSDRADVLSWVRDVRAASGEVWVTRSALSYYAKYYFDSFSEEYKMIKSILDEVDE